MRRARRLPLRTLSAYPDTLESTPFDEPGQYTLLGAIGWGALGALLLSFSVALTLLSPAFDTAYEMIERPVLVLVAILVLGGVIFALVLPPLIRSSDWAGAGTSRSRSLLAWIIGCGLIARLILFTSTPMLEDDYQRYLWDGAVTAHGINTYAISPLDARERDPSSQLGRLATEGSDVVRRINHPHLKTLYPPVAQTAFAAAHILAPWSLTSWRAVVLACDLVVLLLILLLLHETGRSLLWSALYWWNPLVLKELFNSAHMEAVVLTFVLLALLLVVLKRPIGAVVSLALAAGAKIWPILLLPLALRTLTNEPRKLVIAVFVFFGLLGGLAAPMLLGGLDDTSGLAAYAARWQTSSALFPIVEQLTGAVLTWLRLPEVIGPGLAARTTLAIGLAAFAALTCRKPIRSANDLMGRASLVVGALVLVAPAQFPWYAIWFAPFLAFRPWAGFLVLTATMPLYYLFFYFAAHEHVDLFENVIVWIIWVPVWAALLFDVLRQKTPTHSS